MDRYLPESSLSRRQLARRALELGGAAIAFDALRANGVAADGLKVGALHVGSVNDHGYNEAMHEGLMVMQQNVAGIELLEAENVPESADAERVMENMIQQGAKLVYPLSFGYLDPALAVAERHPDVTFEHPAGYKQSENLGTFWSDTTSFEYLMGIVAGSSTKTNKMGWIVGFPIPNILVSINAFQLGAKSVNPNVTTNVIVNSTWVDPAKEAQAVDALANNGVDVVTMIVDSPSTIVSQAGERGIMSMGFHCLCVQDVAGDGWLTGIGFVWGPLFTQVANDVINGTWQSANKVGTLEQGWTALAPYGPNVTDPAKQLVEQKKTELISGDLQIFKGPIKDNKGEIKIKEGEVGNPDEMLTTVDWLVEGVEGQTS
jgi:basic membrane protein A